MWQLKFFVAENKEIKAVTSKEGAIYTRHNSVPKRLKGASMASALVFSPSPPECSTACPSGNPARIKPWVLG